MSRLKPRRLESLVDVFAPLSEVAQPLHFCSRKTPCAHRSTGPSHRSFPEGPLGKDTCGPLPRTVWRVAVSGPPSGRPQQETGAVCRQMESLNHASLNWSPRDMSTQLRDQLLSFSWADKWKARGEKWWERKSGAAASGASRRVSRTRVRIPKWNWWRRNLYEKWWVMLPKKRNTEKKNNPQKRICLRN